MAVFQRSAWLLSEFVLQRRQGVFAPGTFGMLGLPPEWYGALEYQYPPHQRQGSYEEEGRAINTMKVRGRRACTSVVKGQDLSTCIMLATQNMSSCRQLPPC